MTAATPGQAAYEVGDRVSVTGTVVGTNRRLDWVNIDADGSMFAFNRASTSPAISHIAAQEPHAAPGFPLRSDAETAAMLRADLADAEAQLARWPKCPAVCNCRIGIEDDPDRNECGCDGSCNGGEQPAPEFPAAGAALARVLSWFTGSGTRREASATRAQLAHAYQDGGLTVPEELRRFL